MIKHFFIALSAASLLSACTTIDLSGSSDDDHTGSLPPLEVPPTLVKPNPNYSMQVPSDSTITYDPNDVVVPSSNRISSGGEAGYTTYAGSRTQISVQASPNQIWESLLNFIEDEEGFGIEIDDQSNYTIISEWGDLKTDSSKSWTEKLVENIQKMSSRDRIEMQVHSGAAGSIVEVKVIRQDDVSGEETHESVYENVESGTLSRQVVKRLKSYLRRH